MKTIFLTIILSLLVIIPIPMNAFTAFNALEVEDENKEDIELKGDMEDDRQKSLVLPFGAYQTNNNKVCVMSYDVCSNATIYILDVSGQTMDYFTSSLSSLQIVSFDINGYPNGTYTLVISTPQGTYLTGVFEVDL